MTDFYLSQEVRVFLHTGSAYHEIVPQSGTVAFSQISTSTDVAAQTLPFSNSTSNVASKKASEKIKTEFDPGSWSFSTFIRPLGKTDAHAILWKYFLDHNFAFTSQILEGTGHNRDFDFNQGGSNQFFDLYFHFPNNKAYKMSNCVVNVASISMAIEGLSTVTWEGLGTSLDPVDFTVPTITNSSHIASSSGKVIGKLSTVSYTGVNFTLSEFTLPITEGSIVLSHNISAISYPILGEITKPFSFTKGIPTATGSFSGYITGTVSESETKKFVKDLVDSTDPVVQLDIRVGSSTTLNNMHVKIPYAFVEAPALNLENILSFSTSFTSLTDGTFGTSTSNTAYKVFFS